MRWPAFSRQTKIGLSLFGLLLMLAFLPLRIVLDLAGTGTAGASARQVRGPVWWGRIDGLALGPIVLGDVRAAVSPVQLLVGRIRLDLWRDGGQGGDGLRGAWTAGFNQRGIDDVTGSVPLGGVFAPLPLSALEFEDVTVHFANDSCARAQGRVRARLDGQFGGLNLSQGLSGEAICDGAAVLFPLVSQTGLEKLSLRLWRDGRYTARIAVTGASAVDAAALSSAGLTQQGDEYALTLEGRM